jgi:hypothetical protein
MMGNKEFLHCLSLLPQEKSKTRIYGLWFRASSNIQIKQPDIEHLNGRFGAFVRWVV